MISNPALAIVSAGVLAYEVLLVRLFAIVQWHHFAFMAISVALLGFGVSGALIAVFQRQVELRAAPLFGLAATLFAVTAPLAFLVAQNLPFNALEVVWNPAGLGWLGGIYLALAVPFTAGAACIGLAFVQGRAAPGRVYLWNLVGSAAGALGIVAALFVLPPLACLLVVAALGFLAALVGELARGSARGAAAAGGAAALGAIVLAVAPDSWSELEISEFKGLTRALAVRHARPVSGYWSPLALVTVVESPTVPFRHAPGLSLQAPALPPPQLGVFVDGEFAAAIDAWDGRRQSLAYLDHSTDALAYHLLEHDPKSGNRFSDQSLRSNNSEPAVLALGAAAGRPVLQAIGHGAERVDAVETNPDLLEMVRTDFADYAGGLYGLDPVTTHVADPRRFLAAHRGRWDIVQLAVDGSGAAGARGLSEDYLMTVEGLALALGRLAPGGWLSATVGLDLPPRTALKLVATLSAALAAAEIGPPSDHLLAIRGMTTVTVLAGRDPVSPSDVATTRRFAEARSFDLVYYPGMPVEEANRRNMLDGPVFHDAVAALVGPQRSSFIESYKFDIAPATDDRPYFHDVFSWAALPELLALGPAGGAALLELGELIVAATLVQAVLLGLVLVLAPLRALPSGPAAAGMVWRFGAYFTGLGLAFLFVELAWIQKFVLFLGHPLYAVSVVLTGFLLFAGLGAGASPVLQRRLAGSPISPPLVAVAAIAVVALGYLVVLPGLLDRLAALSDAGRLAVSLALIAPLAFFMGMPFPLGLARVAAAEPGFVPWAWGLNGCASVASAAAAPLLTMNFGFAATVVIAVAIYIAAALALGRHNWRG